MGNFYKIHLYGVDRSGFNFEVHGNWDGTPFHIDMNVEVDGSTIDTKPLGSSDDYDPSVEDPDFFDELLTNETFNALCEKGHKVWELLQTIPE